MILTEENTTTTAADGLDDVDQPDGLDGLDGVDQADGLDGVDQAEARPDNARPATLGDHIAAVLYQARMLTVADLLDCGPGVAAALDALATATDTRRPAAAAALVEAVTATEGHRAALDARPTARPALDGPGEPYPRGVLTAPPRYSHADRRATLIGCVRHLAEHLAEQPA